MPKKLGRDVKEGQEVSYDSDSPDAYRIRRSFLKSSIHQYGLQNHGVWGGAMAYYPNQQQAKEASRSVGVVQSLPKDQKQDLERVKKIIDETKV